MKRLQKVMMPTGMEFSYVNRRIRGCPCYWFVRDSVIGGCFERVSFLGDASECYVDAWVSITPATAVWEGMVEEERISECSGKIRNNLERAAWERRVVEYVPLRCRSLAERRGPEILDRTRKARAAAKFYLDKLPEHIDDLAEYWGQLKRVASPDQRELAKFSLRTSVLTLKWQTPDEEDRAFHAYQIAAYTITLHADEATDLGFFPAGTDPHVNQDFGICLQLMTSRIYGEARAERILLE